MKIGIVKLHIHYVYVWLLILQTRLVIITYITTLQYWYHAKCRFIYLCMYYYFSIVLSSTNILQLLILFTGTVSDIYEKSAYRVYGTYVRLLMRLKSLSFVFVYEKLSKSVCNWYYFPDIIFDQFRLPAFEFKIDFAEILPYYRINI